MDTAQWPQEIVVKPIEEIVTNTYPKPTSSINNNNNNNNNNSLERKLARPQKEQALNCPRCNSTNTKFCYYNNYSLTQPRYFCKTCRRYWTDGGSLRSIPVGGGSRKNKRSSSSSLSSSPSTTITNSSSTSSRAMTKLPDLVHPSNSNSTSTTQVQNKIMMINQGQDLNLGFPSSTTTVPHQDHFRNISDFVQLPNLEINHNNKNGTNNKNHISAMELLTGLTSRGFNSFMPMPVLVPDHHNHQHPNTVYGSSTTTSTSTSTTTNTSSGFSLIPHEFKPSLNFSLDGLGSGGGYESLQGAQEGSGNATNGRLLFPFEDLKQVSAGSNGIDHHNNKDQGDTENGYWTGMLGGGSW